MNIYNYILSKKQSNQNCFALLIDPDKIDLKNLPSFIEKCNQGKVDIILVGGSMVYDTEYEKKLVKIKSITDIPVVIFPGSPNQISATADAILFLSLLSGRNPEYLIGSQVAAAPLIHKLKLEAVSTAYLLIESGHTTSVEFVSNTKPIPRDKVNIAIAHALAAELLGFKLLYLEAGSGADIPVPDEMVRSVSKAITIPLIVGGGITSPDDAAKKVAAGADIIVVGNHFEGNNTGLIKDFSQAIHA